MNLDMDSRLFQPVNNFRVVAFEYGVLFTLVIHTYNSVGVIVIYSCPQLTG